ncbi:MAG: DNA replication and repair protein RecF [Candidatus Latescibacteria bacterium]|nr:DNA replication and repair protein RecF [Candidatus Latescibacterota bacterium]
MRLRSVELRDFRNHREIRLDPGSESALLLGENGAGKTNLIEAIVLLSIGRSFRGARDSALTRRGAKAFEVRGLVEDRIGAMTEISVRGGPDGAREFTVDGEALPRLTELLGRFHTVHFSVEDVASMNGVPASRRRFLDAALCQLEPAYIGSLREYVAALRQRNRILFLERRGVPAEEAEWAAWEAILARDGAEIDRRRRAVCVELEAALRTLSDEVDPGLRPGLEYCDGAGAAGVDERRALLAEGRAPDRRMGWTMLGPHRARLRCTIGGEELSDGASRGYARLYSILLRLALARIFEERRSDPPVVLLDDPESELDPRWIGRLLRLVPRSHQLIVTACRDLSEMPKRFRRVAIGSPALEVTAA